MVTEIQGHFSAVLFEWRGTLFYDESDDAWIRASAASIGRRLSDEEVNAIVRTVAVAADHPEVVAARQRADCSRELHEAATLLQFRLAGLDEDLARAILERDGNVAATMPYTDTRTTLETLRSRGLRIGVISNIHYELGPHFQYYGLDGYVDAFTLSFQHGYQKPDRRLFAEALCALGADPGETLMVGNNPALDGGAVRAGIPTLILPRVANSGPRGFESVLSITGCIDA